MRFVFFFFAEWANLWVMSALITTLFLGGWQIPGIGNLDQVVAGAAVSGKALWILLSVCVFFAKTLTIVFVVIWIRWTDLNASGADDGLGVDEFQLIPREPPVLVKPSTLGNMKGSYR